MNNNLVLLHLSLIESIGPAVVQKIESRLPADMLLNELYHLSAADITHIFKISPILAQKISDGLSSTQLLEQEIALATKHQINWCTWHDPLYPQMLKEIHVPPVVLYWQGPGLHCQQEGVALVGSRKATPYTNRVINSLVPPLVEHGFTIVSGGALGADTMAHKATLDAGGNTIAVLGSGLLAAFPAANRKLFESIAYQGAMVSSFSLTMIALPGNFPARNRIIAGLSKGTVVVAAARKSGALITARYALDQGREVFAVPGLIDDELSAGCHDLIRQGATLVTGFADILKEFGIIIESEENAELPSDEKGQQQSLTFKPAVKNGGSDHPVLKHCFEPCTLEDLLGLTGISYQELTAALFDLQLEGKIEQTAAGLWHALF